MFSITQESKTLEIMKDTDLPELNLVQFTDEDIDKMRFIHMNMRYSINKIYKNGINY